MILGTLHEVILTAPVSFCVGVGVGLFASSRWLIVRRHPSDELAKGGQHEDT